MPHRPRPETPPRRSLRTAALALTTLAALLVMLFAIPQAGAAFKYLKTGMEVPEFALKTPEGQEYTLAQVKGQPATLLIFWATWSPRSAPALEEAQKLHEQLAAKGLRVVGVNVNRISLGPDDRRQIDELREKLKLTFPLVVDAGLETYNAFGVVATPSTALVDTEGKMVHETASWLRDSGSEIRVAVEVLLGLREAPQAAAVAAAPAFKPDAKALRHFNFGRTMLQRGNRDKAADQFEQAAAADPKYAAPRVFLGQLLLAKKGPESAAKAAGHFAAALAVDPANVPARTGNGEALLELGKLDEAAAEFEKAVAQDATYTPAVSSLALTLARQGKAADAEARFKAALELNPLDAGTYFRRGLGSEAVGNLKGAAQDLRRAVEILMNLPSTGDEV
ncbi:MAG TPA: redoxin domain-containing protein [Candidatus Methanoperedens sp.]|nr:redoxin domain-containing protein [Candidatus Methanoperedens sp.]